MFRRLLALIAVCASLAFVHLTVVRPWFLTWGATPAELSPSWPVNELVVRSDEEVTRAITIAAPASRVWPWIAQAGQDRAGMYSYRLLENLAGGRMPRVQTIVPAWQSRRVGEPLWLYPPERAGGIGYVRVDLLMPERAMVLGTGALGREPGTSGSDGSWTFLLEPIDTRTTRLIMLGRAPAPESWAARAFSRFVFEPAHFVMERRMMEEIRSLAQGRVRSEASDNAQASLWIVLGIQALTAGVLALIGQRWKRALAVMAAAWVALAVATLLQPSPVLTLTMALAIAVAAPFGRRGRPFWRAVHSANDGIPAVPGWLAC